MSESALYRKYRPEAFDEVLGQEHVITPLKESIRKNAFSHAYLFSGSRGTGKTSVARLFAKAIGCAPEDIHEMDAASNRKIDDIRELRDAVRSLPLRSPYKLYIIDEVHMLTPEARDAFLKTLEEPPQHAVFVLATTDPEKLTDTIISRCQAFAFKKPSQAILKQSAERIAKKEGYTLKPGAAEAIAMLGDGSFRDMQGVLQRVLNTAEETTITRDFVEQITDTPPAALVSEVVDAFAYGDANRGLKAVRAAADRAVDTRLFLKMIINRVRTVLLLRFGSGVKEELKAELPDEELAHLIKLAGKEGAQLNSQLVHELIEVYTVSEYAHLPHLPLELAIIKLCGASSEHDE